MWKKDRKLVVRAKLEEDRRTKSLPKDEQAFQDLDGQWFQLSKIQVSVYDIFLSP